MPKDHASKLKHITIYTDGACLGNPGPGGYGVVLLYRGRRKELSGSFRLTTNNRMEIIGVIAGLRALKERCKVTVYSDSKYVIDTIVNGWAATWKENGWKLKTKKPALNADLWEQLLELCSKHEVEFKWVPGHAGIAENERADQLSVAAASGDNLARDVAYEEMRKARDRSAANRLG